MTTLHQNPNRCDQCGKPLTAFLILSEIKKAISPKRQMLSENIIGCCLLSGKFTLDLFTW
jgi:hypothetical protein